MPHPVRIHADPAVTACHAGRPAPDWHQRALYLGEAGAQAWRAVSDRTPYLKTPEALEQLARAVETLAVSTVVSLGPGDGATDAALLARLRPGPRPPQYVPVDLNPHLLRQGIDAVGDRVRVPFGVVADFESGSGFLAGVLHGEEAIEHPALVTLLGGTLGNLDRGEAHFLDGVRAFTRPGDYLLVECPTLTAETLRPAAAAVAAGHAFLLNGIARQTAATVEAVAANPQHLSAAGGASDVPGTEVCTIVYTTPSGDAVPAIKTCRYDWPAAVAWFGSRPGFAPAWDSALTLPAHHVGFGAVLLRRA